MPPFDPYDPLGPDIRKLLEDRERLRPYLELSERMRQATGMATPALESLIRKTQFHEQAFERYRPVFEAAAKARELRNLRLPVEAHRFQEHRDRTLSSLGLSFGSAMQALQVQQDTLAAVMASRSQERFAGIAGLIDRLQGYQLPDRFAADWSERFAPIVEASLAVQEAETEEERSDSVAQLVALVLVACQWLAAHKFKVALGLAVGTIGFMADVLSLLATFTSPSPGDLAPVSPGTLRTLQPERLETRVVSAS
jgi:hypothetical protein